MGMLPRKSRGEVKILQPVDAVTCACVNAGVPRDVFGAEIAFTLNVSSTGDGTEHLSSNVC